MVLCRLNLSLGLMFGEKEITTGERCFNETFVRVCVCIHPRSETSENINTISNSNFSTPTCCFFVVNVVLWLVNK